MTASAHEKHLRLDFTYAKNALFVRQTIATGFGLALDREFNWQLLLDLICGQENPPIPASITIAGYAQMSQNIREEAQMLQIFLKKLKEKYPELTVFFVLH